MYVRVITWRTTRTSFGGLIATQDPNNTRKKRTAESWAIDVVDGKKVRVRVRVRFFYQRVSGRDGIKGKGIIMMQIYYEYIYY